MFYYRVCTHGGTAAQEASTRVRATTKNGADHTEMTANQNRQKKTRGFRLVSKILKAPAESAGPADSKSAHVILVTNPEVAYRGGYF